MIERKKTLNLERAKESVPAAPPAPWRHWLHVMFPRYVAAPFSDRHAAFWEWVEAIQPDIRPRPFVAIWPRGGAKSTSAELACVRLGAREARRYVWYVSGTQDKADKHVDTVGALLESGQVSRYYPDLASRKLGKYGNSKGWRRSRLRTASGLTVDALGLDTGSRGAKVEDARPDFIVLDDIDELHDTPAAVKKKIDTMTKTVLPAGSNDCAILFIQNLIHPDSIASQLSDDRADFLADRLVSGPFPAVTGLAYETRFDADLGRNVHIITAGEATWEGQDLQVCQQQMFDWGLTSFLQEAQHDVEQKGGIWDNIEFRHETRLELPDLVRVVVWVDPAVTTTEESDCQGIQADGIDEAGTIHRLFSWEGIDTPDATLTRAIHKGIELGAEHVGVETNQGGDLWEGAYQRICHDLESEGNPGPFPAFVSVKAGAGDGNKVERNQNMLADYERGQVVHVTGTHDIIERSLGRFPIKPLDLADAAYWSWSDLRENSVSVGSVQMPWTRR